jgi:hypothetical protein
VCGLICRLVRTAGLIDGVLILLVFRLRLQLWPVWQSGSLAGGPSVSLICTRKSEWIPNRGLATGLWKKRID